MTPKSGAVQSAKIESKVTPFEQIRELEEQEKARVEKTLKELAEKETEIAQKAEENRRKEEEELMVKAKEELVAFKNKELTGIMTKEDDKTAEELREIEALYKKNAPKVTQSLVETVTDAHFFTAS